MSNDDVKVSLQDNALIIAAVDANKIDARFKDGVLEVTLPKTEEAKPKQIEVKAS